MGHMVPKERENESRHSPEMDVIGYKLRVHPVKIKGSVKNLGATGFGRILQLFLQELHRVLQENSRKIANNYPLWMLLERRTASLWKGHETLPRSSSSFSEMGKKLSSVRGRAANTVVLSVWVKTKGSWRSKTG